jgi:hypothetical protein
LAFCLYDSTGPTKWGEVKFKGNNVFERIADGQAKVSASLNGLQPDLIIFESAVFIQNKKTVVLLAYAYGAIVAALMQPGIVVEEIPPITWQNAIGNKSFTKEEKAKVKRDFPDQKVAWYQSKLRDMRKQRTMDWVKAQYGIDVTNDNVGDAIAVASVGFDKYATKNP